MATGSIDTGTDQLLCEVREQVAVITLNRPESRNALGNIITPALRRMIRERGEDPDVGALLITGAGTAFCAGGDVKGMANSGPAAASQSGTFFFNSASVRISTKVTDLPAASSSASALRQVSQLFRP